MSTGDSVDILDRIKRLLPKKWFSYVAPYRDAILGAESDLAAWSYSLITYARTQSRIKTAIGIWLDITAWDFFQSNFVRRFGEIDSPFRIRIIKEILRPRSTRAAITGMLLDLTQQSPLLFEPWNPGDMGSYGTGTTAYGFGFGLGSLSYPYQIFITAYQPGQGIPLISGYGMSGGGYSIGSFAYVDMSQIIGGVTNDEIFARITQTIAAGVTAWTDITSVGIYSAYPGQLNFNQPQQSGWLIAPLSLL